MNTVIKKEETKWSCSEVLSPKWRFMKSRFDLRKRKRYVEKM